ncbi:putative chitinase 3, partial [Stegodyphus mimosarum]
MTYDFHGSWEKKTGHHAQFYQSPRDLNPSLNFDSAVNHWLNLGANSSKLVLGIPSYGRTYTLADKKINGFNAPALGPGKPGLETAEGGINGFSEICQDNSWILFPNDLIGSYSVKGDQWVSYDTPKMAVLKSRYIRDSGLGGAAYRFFHTDDYQGKCFGMSFPILRSIQYGLGVNDEKDFETSEDDTKTFLGKMQLAILIDENRSVVIKEENKYADVSDSDINLKLTETVRTDSGQEEVKELKVNAG